MNLNTLHKRRNIGGSTPPPTGHEPETTALMASIGWADDATVSPHNGLTYAQVYTKLDTYFTACKAGGVWSKLKAVYLFIGNNSDNHKWNAVNPQNTDAAFRMLWSGSGIHSSSGWQGDGNSSYGNTNYIPALVTTLGSEHISIYSTTNNTPTKVDSVDIGSFNSVTESSIMSIRGQSNKDQFLSRLNSDILQFTNIDAKGFYLTTRNGSNLSIYKNGSAVNSGVTGGSLNNYKIYLGTLNFQGTPYSDGYTNQNYAYLSIGDGLTQAEVTAHYNAVQQLQTDLGRNV